MQSIELIREFLRDRLGVLPEALVPSAQLVDLGVDSLMFAELLFEAEDRLGISIEATKTPPQSIGEMATMLDEILAAKAAS